MICPWILPAKYFFFTPETSSLVYYSHITSLIVSIIILFLINFSKEKSSSKNLLSGLLVVFIAWVFFNLILWTNNNSQTIIFFWSFFGLLTSLISIISFWLYRSFVLCEKNNLKYLLLSIIPIIPIIIITPTSLNLESFDIDVCGIAGNATEGNFPYYFFGVAFVFFFLIVISFLKNLKKLISTGKKQSIIFSLGIIFFMLSFFTASFLASYLADSGIIQDFGLEQYGLFGMTVFMAVITFIIVRFKAFDIKLIGSQALVWALVILVGSQFLFIQTNINRILTAITLLISAVVGLIIVRSVKKEIALREELQTANENQQLLIRFITHQVKGFFTKSKMIFSSALEGDFGEMSDQMKEMVKTGLESDNKAVDMVQEVLKASSLRTGEMTYNFEEVDLTGFTKEIAEGFRETAVAKGLIYEVTAPADKLLSKIDKLQMTQVFKNLIDNSVKYTLTGSVKVGLKAVGQKILFSIVDTGVGLSDSDKAKLFKEGGRGEESLKVNVNSTGYGLFIVKKIVEGHGGRIWAESAGRGHGSRFYVEVPAIIT